MTPKQAKRLRALVRRDVWTEAEEAEFDTLAALFRAQHRRRPKPAEGVVKARALPADLIPTTGVWGYPIVEVVSYSIHPEAIVVGVQCINGCVAGRTKRSGPKVHFHGWTTTSEWGGDRTPHCFSQIANPPAYELHWPGGVPADVIAALATIYPADIKKRKKAS